MAAEGVACERCGTFTPPAELIAGRCPGCRERSRAQAKLYPYGYVVALGALMNVVVALVLMALNYRALEEKKRSQRMWVAAGVAAVAMMGLMALPIEGVGGWMLGLNIGIASLVARPYRPIWVEHKAKGGPRANLWWPVVFTVVAVLVLAFAIVFAGGEQ